VIIKQVRPSVGTDIYPHMQILRHHAVCCHEFGSQRVIVVNVVEVVTHWPIRPILGFGGSKVHKNGRFPALDADEPPCKM